MNAFRVLVVGDLHAVPDELDDCNKLLQHILTICRTEEITEVWWTGDQTHTHAVLRLEVLHWLKVATKALKNEGINSVFLVGNHDQASPGQPIHSMMALEYNPGVKVIDTPTVHRGVLFVPYMHDEKEFVEACNKFTQREYSAYDSGHGNGYWIGPKTLFCHQTFSGATYENGFYANDGFDPNLVPQELVISGHIHTGQEFGKVWYVGAPRWRSLSDANVERAVWVLEFEADGQLIDRRPYSTGSVCRQIKHLDDTPDAPVRLPLDPAHQWRIDIKGPVEWCQARKTQLKAAGARIRTFPDQVKTARVRESEGVEKAFRTFLGAYQAKHGTSRETLEAMAKERLSV